MKPTVGRIVHYTMPDGKKPGPYPAMVTAVHRDLVDLVVFGCGCASRRLFDVPADAWAWPEKAPPVKAPKAAPVKRSAFHTPMGNPPARKK